MEQNQNIEESKRNPTEHSEGTDQPLLCDVCGHELTDNQAQLGNYHVSCAERKIIVYTISLGGAIEYHKTLNSMLYNLEILLTEDPHNSYFVGSVIMSELKFRTLPEFEGF